MTKDREKVVGLSKKVNKSRGVNIIEVAKYFTELGPMKVRKLQILCFYAQAWYLAYTGERFMDSDFQAWMHGPTSRILHDEYSDWGSLEIPRINYEHNLTLTDQQKDWIKAIYSLYDNYSAKALETLSKSEDPYITARNGLPEGEPCLNVISDKSIENYYRNLLGIKENQEKKAKIIEFSTQKK
ncbi:MAG: DUF4065 domain-containing protein [Bacilli bacterium]|nr:DUF4065 domain-containing protein [Bacilli bacterium]